MQATLILGDCYTHTRQPDKAKEVTTQCAHITIMYYATLQAYSTVLKYDPSNTLALHNLAVVMAEQKQYTEAVELFSAVIQLDPDHKTATKYLTLAQKQLKNKRHNSR